MKNHKYRLENLVIYDYRGVEEHLSQMAAKGWELEKAGFSFWKYRRIEPAQIRYAVTYSPDASRFNPGPTVGQQSLEELCAAAGWKKICDWNQMQIFSSREEHPMPLETDEGLRLENIHRAMKKSLLLGNLVLLLLALFWGVSIWGTLFTAPFKVLSSNGKLFSGSMWTFLALLELYTFAHYFLWRRRSLRSIADGGGCVPLGRGCQIVNKLSWAVLALLLAGVLLAGLIFGNRGSILYLSMYMSLFFVVVFLVRKTTELLQNRKVSKGANIVGTLVVDVVLCLALIGGLAYVSIHFGWFSKDSGETYEYQNRDWDAHPVEGAPLTLSGLTGESYAHIRREWVREGSLLLPSWSFWERALPEDSDEARGMAYTIWDTENSWMYQSIVDNFQEKSKLVFSAYWMGRPENPADWGVEAVYRRYFIGSGGESPESVFLLCQPGRIVRLELDGEPSAAERQRTVQALFPESTRRES